MRNDPFWLVLACVIERALFFQPLNRIARAGLLHSAEYLADEWAARRAGGVPLAKALVKVAEWIQASPLGVPVAGYDHGGVGEQLALLYPAGCIPPNDPTAAVPVVKALLENPPPVPAEHPFTLQAMLEGTMAVYAELLA